MQGLAAAVAAEELDDEEAADHDVERVVRTAEAAWTIEAEAEAAQVEPAEAMEQKTRQKTAKDTTKLGAGKEWRQQRRWQRQNGVLLQPCWRQKEFGSGWSLREGGKTGDQH